MIQEIKQYTEGIEVLKCQRKAKIAEAEIIGLEIAALSKAIWELEWMPITRDELKAWLVANGGRIQVMNRYLGTHSYASVMQDGRLKIGGYTHHDLFPEGCTLFVKRNFEAW